MTLAPQGAGSAPRWTGGVWATGLGLTTVALALAWFVRNNGLNADEGFYGVAAREVWRGHLPYRDFGFTQPPVFPYVAGAVLGIIGHSLLHLRIFCAACAFAALAGATWSLHREGRRHAAVALPVLLLGSCGWLVFSATTKTYALAGVFLTAAAFAFLADTTWRHRLIWVSVWGSLAVSCRLPTLPFVCALWIALVWERRNPRDFALACLVPLAGAALLLGPFAAADWLAFGYWTWGFHSDISAGHLASQRLLGLAAMALPVWLALLGTVVMAMRTPVPSRWRWLLAACALGVACNVGPDRGYGEYAAPFVVPSALAVVLVSENWLAARRWRSWMAGVAWLAAGWCPWFFATQALLPLPAPRLLSDLDAASAKVRELAGPSGHVIASVPEVPYDAGANIPLDLVMGKFALTADMDSAAATRLGFTTPEALTHAIASGTAAAVVLSTPNGWNFAWSLPSCRALMPEEREPILRAAFTHYAIALQNDHFTVLARRPAEVTP